MDYEFSDDAISKVYWTYNITTGYEVEMTQIFCKVDLSRTEVLLDIGGGLLIKYKCVEYELDASGIIEAWIYYPVDDSVADILTIWNR